MARLWKGAPVAAALSERVAAQVERLKQRGVSPALAIVRVGQRPEDLSYERGALKRCEMVGITVKQFILPDTVELTELLHIVEAINQDAAIHGCLLFRPLPRHLDEARMQAAAQQFVGRHDFLALCAAGSSAAAHGDTVRTITDCHVTRKGDEIDIEVTADGYLYNMVRILAGTLCEAGAGRLDPAEIPAILASRDRSRAGPTLPAKGLFLKCVEYDL